MQEILRHISTLENFTASGGASAAQIQTLENDIGFEVPGDYRAFLSAYGSCLWFGAALFGIGAGKFAEFKNLDARSHIEAARKRTAVATLDHILPVAEHGAGGFYLLTPSNIVLVDDENPDEIADRWPSFQEFLGQWSALASTGS